MAVSEGKIEPPVLNLDLQTKDRLGDIKYENPTESAEGNALLRHEIYKTLKLNDEQIAKVERDLVELAEKGKISTYNADEREWEFNVIDLVRNAGNWPLPSVSEWNEPVESLEIVVHPLYGFFVTQWDPVLWKECKENHEEYIMKKLTALCDSATEALKKDPTSFPYAYFIVKDVLEELDALKAKPQNGQLRILDLPRRSMISDQQIQAYDAFLKTIPSERTVAIDSQEPGTGKIQKRDLDHMKTIVGPNASVEFQGGYINACIDAAIKSFAESIYHQGREDISMLVDTNPSTATIGDKVIVATQEDREKMLMDAQNQNMPREMIDAYRAYSNCRIIPPPTVPKALEEMRAWVSQNAEINSRFEAFQKISGQHWTRGDDKTKTVQYK